MSPVMNGAVCMVIMLSPGTLKPASYGQFKTSH